jgi:hypothetical protein
MFLFEGEPELVILRLAGVAIALAALALIVIGLLTLS